MLGTDGPFGNTRSGPIINMHAAATSATSTALVDVATGAAVAVPAGKVLVIAGGDLQVGGNASTGVLEDEDGNALGPVLTSPANAAASANVKVPPTKVPTAAKSVQLTTTGAGVVASIWCWGYLANA